MERARLRIKQRTGQVTHIVLEADGDHILIEQITFASEDDEHLGKIGETQETKLYRARLSRSDEGLTLTAKADVTGPDPNVTVSLRAVLSIDVKGTAFGIGDEHTEYTLSPDTLLTLLGFIERINLPEPED